MRFILLLVLWVATFVVLAYLLVSGFLLFSLQNEDQTLIKNFLDANKDVIVGFFGLMGAIVALLQHSLGSDLKIEPGQIVEGDSSFNKLEGQYKKLYGTALNLQAKAVKEMANRFTIKVAVFFSFCHLATAGLQGLIGKAYKIDDFPAESIEYKVLGLLQSELMIVAAVVVPLLVFRSYLNEVKNIPTGRTYGAAMRIGGFSLLLVGAVSILTLDPEQLAAMILEESSMHPSVLGTNYLVYTALLRLLAFPMLGFLSCSTHLRFFARKKT